jgi:osmotically-inducible protein OsmY
MSNATLQQAVKEELWYDPMVDAAQIAISADGGVVTLRGTVGSLPQKIGAGRDAKRVNGVSEVKNELQVRPVIGDQQRNDAELRANVLQALMLNSLVPSSIDAKVADGYVTLTGTANWHFEREEAEYVASNVPGVFGVRSEIVLEPAASAADVTKTIEDSYRRLADIEADTIDVQTNNGKVTLSGTVSSWAAHDAAVDAAWWAPGVTDVVDHLQVGY